MKPMQKLLMFFIATGTIFVATQGFGETPASPNGQAGAEPHLMPGCVKGVWREKQDCPDKQSKNCMMISLCDNPANDVSATCGICLPDSRP